MFSFFARARLLQHLGKARALLVACEEALPDLTAPLPKVDTESLRDVREILKVLSLGPTTVSHDALVDAADRVTRSLRPVLARTGAGDLGRTREEAAEDLLAGVPQVVEHLSAARKILERLQTVPEQMARISGAPLAQDVLRRALGAADTLYTASVFGEISPTVIFLELRAALLAYDQVRAPKSFRAPLVSGATYTSVSGKAELVSGVGPFDLSAASTPWLLTVTSQADGASVSESVELPFPGASGRAVLLAAPRTGAIPLPVKSYLYFGLRTGATVEYVRADLTDGTWPLADVCSELAGELAGKASAVVLGDRLAVIANAGYAEICLLSSDPSTPTDAPAQERLGFARTACSRPIGALDVEDVSRAFTLSGARLAASVQGGRVSLWSREGAVASLEASGAAAGPLGVAARAEYAPAQVYLRKGGAPVTSASVGDAVQRAGSTAFIEGVGEDGLVTVSLPAGADVSVDLLAGAQALGETLLDGALSSASLNTEALSRRAAPAVSGTAMDRSDFAVEARALRASIDALDARLRAVPFPTGALVHEARTLLSALEERGMDRAAHLLLTARFQEFWEGDPNSASYDARFLSSIESVGRNDVGEPVLEDDIPESTGHSSGRSLDEEIERG